MDNPEMNGSSSEVAKTPQPSVQSAAGVDPHNIQELTSFMDMYGKPVANIQPNMGGPDIQGMTGEIQNLLQQTQDRFQTMSDQIIKRIDEMGRRIDDLERNIGELMTQAGVDESEK